ncbi:SDR family NAD(P)-dependent oxidoreductase [Photobacterium leiognathi]|uniref:SDR family NAD(P)-dependent oxidoreductase n=1 Tax=Photobacterium leiognathi TaxID=553611 RepID=UPI002739B4AA|nr:SDR family oxidoreductase [Photobacterium leiognathi]
MPHKKVVLVTGANSGIGYEIARELHENGYYTIALDLNNDKSINISDRQYCVNLLNKDELIDFTKNYNEPLDILVNCAGIREICPLLELDVKKWSDVIGVNLTAPFILSQFAAKRMIEFGTPGNIINISSISGLQAEPDRCAYISSKHGVIGLTKSLAFDLGKHDIRVNAIAPGIIETELTEQYFENEDTANLIRLNTPLNKWGNKNNIYKAVKSIIDNDFMTGSVLVVDGGWTVGKEL